MRQAEAERARMLAEQLPSVVCIYTDRTCTDGGSGVLIDREGFGITNFHVIASLLRTRRGYGGLSDGKLYPLEVIGIDPGGDIALFKLSGQPEFSPARLGSADDLRVGHWVAAIGNPFLLAENHVPTITLGAVSGLHRYQVGQGNLLEYADCIQVSTSINPGNSGGPLYDMQGRVVGIAGRASFEERGRINVGVGYAVTIDQVRRFLPALRAGLLCYHGTLGATVRRIDDDLVFNAIQALSPAEKAGLELGDVLLMLNGRAIKTANEFNNALAVLPAGWPTTVAIQRGAQRLKLSARLERLALPDMPLFITDLEQNHAELKRLLAQLRARHAVEPTSSSEAITWTVSHSDQEAQQQPGWPAATIEQEWARLVQPLLTRPALNPDWQVTGGDQVDDQLVSVVQHAANDRIIRWKIDFETGTLRQATFGTETRPEAVRWSPAEIHDFGTLTWPRIWRRSASGKETTIRIDSITRDAAREDGP